MLKLAKFTFYMFGINTYVVYDPDAKEAVVVDPGMSRPEEFDAMEKFIARENLTVTHLINTHLHIDHAIADHWVAANTVSRWRLIPKMPSSAESSRSRLSDSAFGVSTPMWRSDTRLSPAT